MQGLHLTADLYDCACDVSVMTDAETLAALCRTHTLDVGLTLVGEKWHTFPDYQGEPGVTGMLLLAESHLAIIPGPERGGVTLDVYVYFEGDNSSKAERLMNELEAAFKPARSQRNRLLRARPMAPVPKASFCLKPRTKTAMYGFRFALPSVADATKPSTSTLSCLNRPIWVKPCGWMGPHDGREGRVFYHEGLVHPAAIALDAPRSALIVGGGDGGALEELLKHPVENVTLVDLDEDVIKVSREHLQSINKGAFDDPRVTVHIGDGAQFVAQTDQRFDLVLLDLTDPERPPARVYRSVFQQCRGVLNPGGAIVLHLGTPFHEPEQVSGLAGSLRNVFEHVSAYGLHIPLYGSYWALAVASDTLQPASLTPEQVQQRIDERGITDLQYYNDAVHGALFALPNYYRRLVDVEEAVHG